MFFSARILSRAAQDEKERERKRERERERERQTLIAGLHSLLLAIVSPDCLHFPSTVVS